MTIAEVLIISPQTAEVFLSLGLGCMLCQHALSESLEDAAEMHEIDINELLSQLNKIALN